MDAPTVLTIEEHLDWLQSALTLAMKVVEESASPGLVPQFEQPADFRDYVDRRLRAALCDSWAVRCALDRDCLNRAAPWPPFCEVPQRVRQS